MQRKAIEGHITLKPRKVELKLRRAVVVSSSIVVGDWHRARASGLLSDRYKNATTLFAVNTLNMTKCCFECSFEASLQKV